MTFHNIAVAMPLEEPLLRPLYAWGKKFDWSHVKTVHFIHVVKKNVTPFEFGLVEIPDEKTYKDMEPTLKKFIKDEASKILPDDFNGEVLVHVTRDFNPEEEIVETLKKIKSTLVVVATQGKHGFEGFFHNSFTDHLVRFAPCDVYVVRPPA